VIRFRFCCDALALFGLEVSMRTTPLLGVFAATLLHSSGPVLAQSPGHDFPEGAGRDTVVRVCGGCHDINRAKAGYTPDGWHTIMLMKRNAEAPIPEAEWAIVEQYLVKSFPERPRPAAVVMSGPVQATIKLWPVPTPGSRPHDPLAAADGSIWYTGQLANRLGRVEPKTGQIKEYQLKTAHSGPHGLVEDGAGNIWYTAYNEPRQVWFLG
jgi:virginiamycin B lyase